MTERRSHTRRRGVGLALALLSAVGAIGAAGESSAGTGVAPVRNGEIAFFTGAGGKGVETINPDGLGRRLLVPAVRGSCASSPAAGKDPPPPHCLISDLAWSRDGTRLAIARADWDTGDSALYVVRADGRGERQLAGSLRSCDGWLPGRAWLSWSPDGSRIVTSCAGSLYLVSTGWSATLRLTRGTSDADPVWSPDSSSIIFVRGSSLYTIRPDGSDLHGLSGTGGAYNPAWSPDGRKIAFAKFIANDGQVQTILADGKSRRLVVAGIPNGPDSVAWSADGTRLLYSDEPGVSGAFTADVWTIRENGTKPRRVFHQPCCIDYPETAIWSPNGSMIAVSAEGSFFVVRADGSHLRRLTSGGIGVREGIPEFAWQPLRTASAARSRTTAASHARPATPAIVGYPNSIVALGHSVIAAYDSDPARPEVDSRANSWATGANPSVDSLYGRILGANPGIEDHNVNLAKDGANVTEVLSQARRAARLRGPLRPELVVVQVLDGDIR